MAQAVLEDLLQALVSPSGARCPLSTDLRYTENGQELPIGDGLWATVDRFGAYRHFLADEQGESFAGFTTVVEGQTHAHLAIRARVADGAIVEVEALLARPELFGAGGAFGGGPAALDRSGGPDPAWSEEIPQDRRMSRDQLRRTANMYFAGLERNDGKGEYPFAPDCIRIENGFRTTDVAPKGEGRETPYLESFRSLSAREQFETGYFRFVDRIRARRFPVIDPVRGLVFGFAFFDHSGTVREYQLADGTPVTGAVDRPFSWMIAEAFRIEQGLIRRIEAIMTAVPYGMRPNWALDENDIASVG